MTANSPAPPAGTRARIRAVLDRVAAGDDPATRAADAVELRQVLASIHDPLELDAAGQLLRRNRRVGAALAELRLREQRVAVLASSTVDTAANQLTALLVRDGTLPAVRLAGFDQWQLEIRRGAPDLVDLAPRLVALLLDDAAVFARVADPLDLDAIEARTEDFAAEIAEWVTACREVLPGLVVLTTLPLHPLRRRRFVDVASRARLDRAWHRMNAALLDLAGQERVAVLSHEAVAVAAASAIFADDRLRHLARQAYSPQYLGAWSAELAALSRADLGQTGKCLVLDLDNTLWGGVVGDDGIAGLALGDSYPGSAHVEVQTLARDLGRQGVLLAVASKNDDALAREAIATHPEMVLTPESIVALRANWDAKPGNVESIAAELNIGVESMTFLDDNPVEREIMHALLPEVRTLDVPGDAAGFAGSVLAADPFLQLRVSDDDRARTETYRARARREQARTSATSLEGYLAGLHSEVRIAPIDDLNAARIAALFAKTNQFNLTGIRYSPDELAELRARPGDGVFAVRLTDDFGDSGLVCALTVTTDQATGAWHIGNVVLSCRVFSRGVEDVVLTTLLAAARDAGIPAVTGEFRPSPRNQAFAGLYPRLGFAAPPAAADPTAPLRFRHDLQDIPQPPAYLRLHPDSEAFDVR